MEIMEILSTGGKVLFIAIWIVGVFHTRIYWEGFIPKMRKMEEKYPVLTGTALTLIAAVMLIGVMSALMLR